MKANLLEKNKIKELSDQIESSKTRLGEISEKDISTRNRIAEIREKIKFNERENEELKREQADLNFSLNLLAKETTDHNSIISGNEKALAHDKHLQAVVEEHEKQPDFYETLKKRIKLLQDDLGEGFSNFSRFIEPTTAVQLIKTKIDSRGFDRHLIALRGVKSNYDASIWDFCERKVKGETISPQETKALLTKIDDMLMYDDVSVYWNRS